MPTRVKAGRLIPVENKNRGFGGSPKKWLTVWVEDADGGNERCWPLTEAEAARFDERSKMQTDDLTEKGWLTDLID